MESESIIRRIQSDNQAARASVSQKLSRLMQAVRGPRSEWENAVSEICGSSGDLLAEDGAAETLVGSSGDAGTGADSTGNAEEPRSGITVGSSESMAGGMPAGPIGSGAG